MILTKLIELIYNLISKLLIFGLPSLPDSVLATLAQIKSYTFGAFFDIVPLFIRSDSLHYLATLLGLVIALNSAYIVYSLAFWVIRKLPFLDIKE